MRTKKRTLLTTKVYGFNPVDGSGNCHQSDDGVFRPEIEAPILRDLIDEALAARRHKDSVKEATEQPPSNAESVEPPNH